MVKASIKTLVANGFVRVFLSAFLLQGDFFFLLEQKKGLDKGDMVMGFAFGSFW